MNEFLERVAMALDAVMYRPERKTDWSQAPAQHHHTCRLLARTAFEAGREPTEKMVAAGEMAFDHHSYGFLHELREAWPLMIDAALK